MKIEKREMGFFVDDVLKFYENYDEDGRLVTKYGLVEFLTTMRFIEKYLRPGHCVLDIGAGTGRYSHALAQMCHAVDAVELVPHNIEIFKKNMRNDNVAVRQGDARDLSAFADNSYDITLLFGPMYHLFEVEDKLAAISEAIRVTKPGGMVFAAYVTSDAVMLAEGFVRGRLCDISLKRAYDFALHRKEDIDALMANFKTTRLHYVATDGFTNHMRPTMNEMGDATFDAYLKYHFEVCERADMAGISHHVLDIFRKEE